MADPSLRARISLGALALVSLGALWESLAQVRIVRSVPTEADWRAARDFVARTRRDGDLVVAAPQWADPLVRQYLGEFITLEDAARADATRYRRALVATVRGGVAPDVASWPVESEQRFGQVTVRVVRNPSPATVRYDFVRAIDRGSQNESLVAVAVERGDERPCAHRMAMGVQGGGLGQGALAGPSRWLCEGSWVGRTVIEDMEHRGRLCIWAEPAPNGRVHLRFDVVTLGAVLRGYHGIAYEAERGGDHYETGEPVTLEAYLDGQRLGAAVHEDGDGWKPFSFDLGARANQRGSVEFVVSVPPPRDDKHRQARHYCFQADTR